MYTGYWWDSQKKKDNSQGHGRGIRPCLHMAPGHRYIASALTAKKNNASISYSIVAFYTTVTQQWLFPWLQDSSLE